MKNLITLVLAGVIMFVLIIGIVLLLAVGLQYVLQFIPCEALVYAETFLLLGIFMLIAYMAIQGKITMK